MALWKDGEFMTDVWSRITDDQPLPADGFAIVTQARWLSAREAFLRSGRPIGVYLLPDDNIDLIRKDLDHFAVIALEYPTFADGRAYSAARLLRERFGYSGELRAIGDVLIDQIPLMRRVGFNTFEVMNPAAVEQLRAGTLPDVPYYLQPAIGLHEIPDGTRPWARRSAE